MNDFLESYELYHHGVKGQKWGERRYQYQDGSLTPEGKRHYGIGEGLKKAIIKAGTPILKANQKREARKAIVNTFNKSYQKEFENITKDRKNIKGNELQAAIMQANNKATTAMIKKYGAEKFNKAMEDDRMAKLGASLTAMTLGGIGSAALTALVVANTRNG